MPFENKFNVEEASAELHKRYNLHFVDVLLKNGASKVYLFGGALRDMVMGKEWKDADIRVWLPLSPKERDAKMEQLLKSDGIEIKSITPFGEAFTVFRFLPKGSASDVGIDLSVVSEQWLVGPDFTINGLFFDVDKKELVDRFDSIKDMERQVIKTAQDPKKQFVDEPYLFFRAVKTACQFGFELEEQTFTAMKELIQNAEKVIQMTADNEMPGFTEWFLGNMFRGLKYNPPLFEKLWNESGLTSVFMNFTAKRLKIAGTSSKLTSKVFNAGKKYEYEEAISMFLSAVAKELDKKSPEATFDGIVSLFSIKAPKKYEDFIIDSSKILYK